MPHSQIMRPILRASGLCLLAGLFLAACGAPTAPPVVTGLPTVETATPTPAATVEVAPPARPTPTPAPTLRPEPFLPGEDQPVRILPAPVCCLAADPFDQRAVYALLANDRLYLSPDRGQTWQPLPLPREAAPIFEGPTSTVGQVNFYLSPYRPGLLFVRSRGELYRSPDRGQSWLAISQQVGAWTVREDTDRLLLYAWREGALPDDHGLFRSSDQGETWQAMYPGNFPPAMHLEEIDPAREGMLSLALDPGWDEHLYAGTNYGLFRSKDGGRTWEPFETGLPQALEGTRRAPQVTAGAFRGLYALTEGQADGGSAELLLARLAHGQVVPGQDYWEIVARGDLGGRIGHPEMGFYGVYGLEIDPQDEQALYLATADGLLSSRDGGVTFTPLGATRARRPVYRVEAAPGVPTRLYLSTAEGFASLTAEWPGLAQFPPAMPWPRFTPAVEFEVHDRIGGELTALAVDQAAGMGYAAIGPHLVLMDVSQEAVPDLWSSVDLEGELASAIAVAPGRAYALTGERNLREIDVSDRANPRLVTKLNLPGPAGGLVLQEGTLIVSEEQCTPAGCRGGLRFFATTPGLRETAFLATAAPAVQVEFVGGYAYAFEQDCRGRACSAGLRAIDLADPARPRQSAYLELPDRFAAATRQGDHLYVAFRHGLLALDISDPARPRETNPLDLQALTGNQIDGMALGQGYAYLIGGWMGIQIYSLQDPDHPRRLESWQPETGYFPGYILSQERALYLIDTFGEFGYCRSGLSVLDLSEPEDPRPVPAAAYEYVCADRPLLAGERLYLSDWDGLHVLDLSDSLRPRPWSDYTVSGPVNGLVADQLRLFWSNYRASESLYGMDIGDPEHPTIYGPLESSWSMGMALNWNFLYLPAWADGLKVLDVFETGSPASLARVEMEQLGGSARQAVLDGRYLYLSTDEPGLRVLDVANPSRPRIIGQLDVFGISIADMAIRGDHAYLLTRSWENDAVEVLVLDVADPARPRQLGSFRLLEGESASALAVGAGWLYLGGQACSPAAPDYRPCAGRLVAYRLADPERPERAGGLDLPAGVSDIVLDGDRGFLAAGPAGVWALDLRDPARPAILGQHDIPSVAQALAVVFNRLYVAAGRGGLVVLEVAR